MHPYDFQHDRWSLIRVIRHIDTTIWNALVAEQQQQSVLLLLDFLLLHCWTIFTANWLCVCLASTGHLDRVLLSLVLVRDLLLFVYSQQRKSLPRQWFNISGVFATSLVWTFLKKVPFLKRCSYKKRGFCSSFAEKVPFVFRCSYKISWKNCIIFKFCWPKNTPNPPWIFQLVIMQDEYLVYL